MMNRLLLSLCLVFILPYMACSQDRSAPLEISLLTCQSGGALYATFGHSSIRVKDPLNGRDFVFDYGVFDFDTPNFLGRFLKGDLDYKLGVRNFDRFMLAYQYENRGVIEEKLEIPIADRERVFNFLIENYKPENRYYRYDFLFDNCSTRIRDLVEKLEIAAIQGDLPEEKLTFRNYLHEQLVGKDWVKFGIDILLGARVDREMTFEEQMFLPDKLSANLKYFYGTNPKQPQPILGAPKVLITANTPQATFFLFRPFWVLSLALLVLIGLWRMNKPWLRKIASVLFVLVGIAGLFLLFMWVGTSHYSTKANWNLLWLNPFYILLPFLPAGIVKKHLLQVLIGLNILLLLSFAFIPQAINGAALPVIGIFLLFLTEAYSKNTNLVKA